MHAVPVCAHNPPIADFLAAHDISCEIGPPMAYDQHGNYYVTLMLGGACDENNPQNLSVTASTPELARAQYEKDLLAFIGVRKHVIWRTEPEIESEQLGKFKRRWKVYSRLTAYQVRPE